MIVMDALEEKNYQSGEIVIQEGDDGNVMYIVMNGELDCYKKEKEET